MNLIPVLGWIVDEWFSNPNVHGILQNVIQVLTWHPQPLLAKGPRHHGRKIQTIAGQIIINHYLIFLIVV
jgi:hypothetical protein